MRIAPSIGRVMPARFIIIQVTGEFMGFLAERRILITGLLSKYSIAYGIAKACHREGARLAFTYQNER
ncbi:MAG: hypothetical protein LBO79_07500, partial [Zoogloeaceae bacterium]|nr:hypothetical protein [Zoogloeaceae bacterium]